MTAFSLSSPPLPLSLRAVSFSNGARSSPWSKGRGDAEAEGEEEDGDGDGDGDGRGGKVKSGSLGRLRERSD
jgi:hypothetical protein